MSRLHSIPYKYLVATVFTFGLIMDMVDTTVINVAVPHLTNVFHSTTTTVEWTITGYLLSLALFIPAAGWISDRFGTKRTYLLAMAIFVTASALCGQAHSIEELVAFRFLQGAGGGMMTPVGTAMLSREFPGPERVKAVAIMSVPVLFGPMLGPVLGGFLIVDVSWRWIFYINLPVGLIGLAIGLFVLQEHKEAYAQRGFDLIGFVTAGLGTALVLYALSEAGNKGFGSGEVQITGAMGLVILAIFVYNELHSAFPILDLRLFERKLFWNSNLMMSVAFVSFGGFLLIVTLYLQELHGYSALQAGLIQGPASIVLGIGLPFASRYYNKIGPRKMLIGGFSLAVIPLLMFMLMEPNTPWWFVTLLLALRGLPFVFASVACQTILYGPIESEKQGAASSIYNTSRQIAQSLGVALMVTISTTRAATHLTGALHGAPASSASPELVRHTAMMGYHDAFLVAALLMAVPVALSFLINDKHVEGELEAQAASRTGHGEVVMAEA
ncbi:MAG TPA: MDR family MFS transporter [Dehalococcoidia bacterium]|nr:MDR family MFS transporter [Dehalococcoidia bacterium]